ncbi:MAG: dihydroneopterin aldolase [Verrucomicrobiales bacterium]|nr:dihydroneopterin aldolase [Verrucomicrobiales bacterium]
MSDHIHIKGLRVVTTVGVPGEERARPQTVSVSVSITLAKSFKGFDDRLDHTIDYYAVSEKLREIAASGERKLIETLAEDLAAAVVAFDGVCAVTLEVEKFILADCDSVSVVITRAREHG